MGSKKNLLKVGSDQIEGRCVLSKSMIFPFIASLDYLKELSNTISLAEILFKSSFLKLLIQIKCGF